MDKGVNININTKANTSGFDESIERANNLLDSMGDLERLSDSIEPTSPFDVENAEKMDAAIQKATSSLREMGETSLEAMKHAASIGDQQGFDKAIEKLLELKEAYDSVADATEIKVEMSPETDAVLKELDESLQKITEESVLLEEQWAKQTKLSEKAFAAEEKKAEAIKRKMEIEREAAKRAGMSYDELCQKLDEYQKRLQAAMQTGSGTEAQALLKHIQDTKKELIELEKKNPDLDKGFDGVGKSAQKLAYTFQAIQGGMRGLIHNIPGLLMSLGAGAGLAGVLTLAAQAGMALYGHFNKPVDMTAFDNALDKAQERLKAATGAVNKADIALVDKQYKESADARVGSIRNVNTALQEELDWMKKIAQEAERQTNNKLADEDFDFAIKNEQLNQDAISGKYSDGDVAGMRRKLRMDHMLNKQKIQMDALEKAMAQAANGAMTHRTNIEDAESEKRRFEGIDSPEQIAAAIAEIEQIKAAKEKIKANMAKRRAELEDLKGFMHFMTQDSVVGGLFKGWNYDNEIRIAQMERDIPIKEAEDKEKLASNDKDQKALERYLREQIKKQKKADVNTEDGGKNGDVIDSALKGAEETAKVLADQQKQIDEQQKALEQKDSEYESLNQKILDMKVKFEQSISLEAEAQKTEKMREDKALEERQIREAADQSAKAFKESQSASKESLSYISKAIESMAATTKDDGVKRAVNAIMQILQSKEKDQNGAEIVIDEKELNDLIQSAKRTPVNSEQQQVVDLVNRLIDFQQNQQEQEKRAAEANADAMAKLNRRIDKLERDQRTRDSRDKNMRR